MRHLTLAALILALAACGPSTNSGAPAPPAAAPAPVQLDPVEAQARVDALPAPYNAANYAAGRQAFGQCASCHTLHAGGANRQGPNLHGLFGREIGARDDFNYSQAVSDADFVWDPERLDHWLANPREFLPGNRMAFVGVRNETQRQNLIAYLMVATAP